ncbi:MAG: serine/threonine protein kinase [Candidatus Brocadiae bacterium]|nr:serine/threonine protein kinase [Candidatus Brocadiia bacterium]
MAEKSDTLDPERMQGEEIGGCKIIEKIATGGMGTVYRAEQVSMNRMVAIKCLAEDFSRDQQYVGRFVREARAAGELSHTNLIHVMDVGVYQGVYYYIMEYVDGQSVDRILKIKSRLEPETAVEILIQAAKALAYAHEHDIIHRDIKPDNLMITKDGVVKIADLGIAKKLDPNRDATDAGLVLGTPNYMAPEQAQDASLTDRRSDIYALGSTAYHMLTGKPPYTGKNALEVLTSVVKKKPVPIEKVRPDLPKGLVQVVNKMMMRDPSSRHASMVELAKDLEAYKAGKLAIQKAETSRWEDEDDEEAAQKARVDLELETDEESARRSGVILRGKPKAAGEAGESVKLSGTRVMPAGPAPEAMSNKAIGAIVEKPKSKVVPVLTLLGAIVVGWIGWVVVKRMTAPPEPSRDTGRLPTVVTDTGDKPAPGEFEAAEALAQARMFEKKTGISRLDAMASYTHISRQYPDTPSGKAADAEADRILKEWTTEFETRMTDARKRIEALGEAGSFVPVIESSRRARSVAAGRQEFLQQVNLLDREIQGEAQKRFDAIMGAGRAHAAKKDWLPAIAEAMRVVGMEHPSFRDDALKSVSDWREKWRAEREEAIEEYYRILQEAQRLGRGDEASKVEPRPDQALEKLKTAAKQESLKSIAAVLEQDVELFRDAAAAVDEAWAVVGKMAADGARWKFSKEAFANNTEVTVKKAERPLVIVDFNGRQVRTKPLVYEDIYGLASSTLRGTPEGRRKLAAFLFGRGDAAGARRLVEKDGAAESGALRRRLDDFRIRTQQLRGVAVDLLSSEGQQAWDPNRKKGDWIPRANGEELFGSGEPGEIVLAQIPEGAYVFELEARKDSGPSGFGVFFTAWGVNYQWQIGDETNTFSIVRGIPSTRTADVVTAGDPMLVRVAVIEDRAVGWINGERRWEISKSTPGQPEPGPGLGLGVLHTFVRFRHVKLVELSPK